MNCIEELIFRFPSLKSCEGEILAACRVLRGSFQRGGKLLVAGNGGSCADSEHITGELLKGFALPRKIDGEFSRSLFGIDPKAAEFLSANLQKSLPAISLSANSVIATAVSNDIDARLAFAQQIMGLGSKGDMFLAISTSGNAENLYYAAIVARARGMKTVALTGKDGGTLKKVCDVSIVAPEHETHKIQELHLPIYHAICLQLEEDFFG